MHAVHFAITPLAGAPLRIVQAINAHTPHTARLVDLCRYGTEDFGQDVVFSEQPELACALAENADIIHFHNYLDLDSRHFAPIDFRRLQRKGTLVIRHFHSHPGLVASRMGITAHRLLEQPIPSLVVAQFQERYYPRSRVVPNFVPEADPLYSPLPDPVPAYRHDVFFSPTNFRSAWEDRWNTKSAPQAHAAIIAACKQAKASWVLVHKTPLREALALKQMSRIVVDDLTTGSYHLTGLEALSQGKPVLCYLDGRTQRVFSYFAGTAGTGTPAQTPFVHTPLEELPRRLGQLLAAPEDAAAIGRAGRTFMLAHWPSARMAEHLSEAYDLLARDPALVTRQPELALTSPVAVFFARTLPDIQHRVRQMRAGGTIGSLFRRSVQRPA